MIRVENVTKYYGERLAVDDISFNVEKGEIVGFLGPNAAGKTTTMRSIMRILADNGAFLGGKILYGGKDILDMSDQEIQKIRRENISMIFQDPTSALNPVFTHPGQHHPHRALRNHARDADNQLVGAGNVTVTRVRR